MDLVPGKVSTPLKHTIESKKTDMESSQEPREGRQFEAKAVESKLDDLLSMFTFNKCLRFFVNWLILCSS